MGSTSQSKASGQVACQQPAGGQPVDNRLSGSIRVMLVDDHHLVRDGLRFALQKEPGITVVGEASCGRSALEKIAGLAPEVVLMDIRMPNMNGIDAIRQILQQYPKVQIIALSGFADQALVEQAIQAGATGYLLKTSTSTEIATAIRTITDGRIFLSQAISNGIINNFCKHLVRDAPATPPPRLSEREIQVLRLVVEGLKTKAIAAKLGIGSRTVETYREKLRKKLCCTSNSQLISWAILEGIAAA